MNIYIAQTEYNWVFPPVLLYLDCFITE